MLTKDQQEFWDILKLPYDKTCGNCFWNTNNNNNGVSVCNHLARIVDGFSGCSPMNNRKGYNSYWRWTYE